jgi:hypothetical protein
MTRNDTSLRERDRSAIQIALLIGVPWLCLLPSLWLILR